MVRILIADDHAIIRQTLRQFLEGRPDWQICGEAANGREAVDLATRLQPDIAVLDLSMPGLNGVDATMQIRRASPTTRILIFSMHEGEVLARRILAAGAHGFLLKSDATTHVEAAIEALLQGATFLTPALAPLAAAVPDSAAPPGAGARAPSLTPREREILRVIAEGRTTKEIARRFDLTVATVQTHRAAIMRKLDAGSVAELVRYAVRHKIIEA